MAGAIAVLAVDLAKQFARLAKSREGREEILKIATKGLKLGDKVARELVTSFGSKGLQNRYKDYYSTGLKALEAGRKINYALR